MKNLIVLDCEVYPNYFLIAFKNLNDGKVVTIEAKGQDNSLSKEDRERLYAIMQKRETFGFNSINYDIPIIIYAMRGRSCSEIHKMSDYIISNNSRGWQTLKHFSLSLPEYIKNCDIQEVSPGVRVSLKLYGARMHSKRLQDIPIAPGTLLTDEDINIIKSYCINDLDTTIDLFNQIKDRLSLRYEMSDKIKKNVISKSDAQIAEVVIKTALENMTKRKIYAPKISPDKTFKYKAPAYIKFKDLILNNILKSIESHNFALDGKGSIKLPPELKKIKIKLGHSTYQLGIGGIHSTEKGQNFIPKSNEYLVDKDVAAYYPSIILNLGLYPKHLGEKFLDIYKNIVDDRLKAKKEGNKVVNESLKIVINGSFGKFGNKYSCLYSPDLMMTVTLTGQLSLLMLIEKLEANGIKVISANTDGFVSVVPKDKYGLYQALCFDWELVTGFDLEEVKYKALHSRDINNYLAIKEDGTFKGKGIFTLDELSKNPQGDISVIAVREYLINNVSIDKTIRNCTDIKKFIVVRSVTGGGTWRGQYLGKVVRWIYSKNGEAITYKKNGNKVAKSDNSRPIMELGEFPKDINYDHYIMEAMDILDSLKLINL